MQRTDFADAVPCRGINTSSGIWIDIPKPLPPIVGITWDLAAGLSEADRALSELAGVARSRPDPHLLIGPLIRCAAVLSSCLEATQASLSDLFLFAASGVADPQVPDSRAVSNSVKALAHGRARLKDLPISLRPMCKIHRICGASCELARWPALACAGGLGKRVVSAPKNL